MSPNPFYRIGDATVTRIDEIGLDGSSPADLYPDAPPATWEQHLGRLGPGSYNRNTGTLVQSIHTWLVRTPDRVVLVDTATGNDKERPAVPVFHHLREPFLQRLAAAGVQPQDVDYVLLTHLHADHVGWNTAWRDARWRPTFPRARHVFSDKEDAYSAALDRGEEPDPNTITPGLGPMKRRPLAGVYADSVKPMIEAGLADRVPVEGQEVIAGFTFLPTPGHSIDHATIRFHSAGEEALFMGDLLHHPLQVYAPDINSVYCEFPEAAQRSRRQFLEDAAAGGLPIFTTHCAETSVGRVTRDGDGFAWSFI